MHTDTSTHCIGVTLMHKKKMRNGILTTWALKMLDYTFNIKYKSGKSHAEVDSLSRKPLELGSQKDDDKALESPVFLFPVSFNSRNCKTLPGKNKIE
ncbi:hypothetical protein PR048_011817 [Dryococelus australis]|uniref:Uncharacterized protein n=1 Tax=Dryococelus australis TaxID=614101 RepID=A0ABQ9HMP6_9NEOP|nr:hypothetical protein PR048_011817 [Dryococelus australis]